MVNGLLTTVPFVSHAPPASGGNQCSAPKVLVGRGSCLGVFATTMFIGNFLLDRLWRVMIGEVAAIRLSILDPERNNLTQGCAGSGSIH